MNKILIWSVTATRGYAEKIVVVPQIADSINEGTLKQWSKNVGDFVKQDEEVATIETDKVDIPVNSPASGYILEHFAAEEDTIALGQNLFKLDLQDAPKEEAPKEESKPAPTSAPKESKPAQQPKKVESNPQEALYGRTETRVKMNRMRTRIAERPIVVNGKVEVRPMMYLALTYDHRIIDGREVVTFLVRVKEILEDPRRLLLDV